MKGIYKGFSSKNFAKNKSFSIQDIDLVKRDILNHIFTRRGERVKMSTFGTRIPDIIFEQLDDRVVSIVREDIEAVIKYDPRVQLVSLAVIPLYDENTILVVSELHYVELSMTDVMRVTIEMKA